jgi:hypothetical protein
MSGLYEVEIEPEVRSGPGWPDCPTVTSAGSISLSACSPSTPKISASLTPVILVARSGNCGSTCYASSPGSPTGWPPGRRVILLTVFYKTRSAETREVVRALGAQKICEAEHGQAHQVFDREVN